MTSTDRYPFLQWLENEHEAGLIDTRSFRLLAIVRHDGYGKYVPHLYVSPLKYLHLLVARRGTFWVRYLTFPCIEIETFQGKSMADGKWNAMVTLGFDPR